MPTVLGLTNDPPSTTMASPNSKHHVSSSTTLHTSPRLSTISQRNHASALEMETQLWRALCDPDSAKTTNGKPLADYIAHDCVMINPLLAPDGSSMPMGPGTRPKLAEVLEFLGQHGGRSKAGLAKGLYGFRFLGEPMVVEVDLMAVALVYKVGLFRRRSGKGGKDGGVEEVEASVGSTWRQTAGADWLLVAFHLAVESGDEFEDN
ncbi:hypothetical protein VTJ49DRAFT_363 [Mycothermus thermophilus]|uniref:DUF4440 domain-containing protein n=1 Tax=Humicola insolens TaxID=85995 RepID=A0ABR3VGA3_HUMIN